MASVNAELGKSRVEHVLRILLHLMALDCSVRDPSKRMIRCMQRKTAVHGCFQFCARCQPQGVRARPLEYLDWIRYLSPFNHPIYQLDSWPWHLLGWRHDKREHSSLQGCSRIPLAHGILQRFAVVFANVTWKKIGFLTWSVRINTS